MVAIKIGEICVLACLDMACFSYASWLVQGIYRKIQWIEVEWVDLDVLLYHISIVIVGCRMGSGDRRRVPVYCRMGDVPFDLVLWALIVGLV